MGQRGANTQRLLYRYSTSPSAVHLRNNELSHDSAPTDRLPADYVRIEKHVDHEIHGRGGLDRGPAGGVAVIPPSVVAWNTRTAENADKSSTASKGGVGGARE